jgi:RecA DNA recombination protein
MSAAQALASIRRSLSEGRLERFLEGRGFTKKPGGVLLGGQGARLARASDLPARRVHEDGSLADLLTTGLALRSLGEGGVVEIAARRSCGRFSIALSALAAATSAGEAAALVDLGDHLDPQGAEAAGVDLMRLLWVRPRRAKEAVAAAEMLLSAGFPLVVADFGLNPRGARYLPDAAWMRLARAAQARGAALLLATPWRLAGVAVPTAVSASCPRPRWQGGGRSPLLLSGLSSKLTLEKDTRARSGLTEPLALRAPEALLPLPPGEGWGEGRSFARVLA